MMKCQRRKQKICGRGGNKKNRILILSRVIPTIKDILLNSKHLEDFKEKIKILSDRDKRKIQIYTKNQSEEILWFYYRQRTISASMARKVVICKKKESEKMSTKLFRKYIFVE